jgi:hypothetical protein
LPERHFQYSSALPLLNILSTRAVSTRGLSLEMLVLAALPFCSRHWQSHSQEDEDIHTIVTMKGLILQQS